ncbi:DNA methyltransferase [Microbispora rosea]|uniref:DNA methyltransferase n=1 Tax=Microbispora rosea TaxID=58117 RepID=UPI003D8F7435
MTPLAEAHTRDLPPEPASGRGRRHGTSSSEPFDRWFRYPAGFASDYASMLLEYLAVPENGLIIDPFAGSGVIGSASAALGFRFFGIEAHPLIAELASLKLQTAPEDPEKLQEVGDRLVKEASALLGRSHLGPELSREPELVQRCFDSATLSELVAIRKLIKSGAANSWTAYAKWSLLGTLRDVASVQVGWPYQRPGKQRKAPHADVFARFKQRLLWIQQDLSDRAASSTSLNASSLVVCGDSRDPQIWEKAPTASAQGCVSSPPYLNNFDYADATRLELYFWGEVRTWGQMVEAVRSEMITATTQQSSLPAAQHALAILEGLGPAGNEISKIADALKKERQARPRGKEYDRVVPEYFAAMAQVLENLAAALEPGASAVWLIGDSAPYGVYVDTPALTGALAEKYGLTVKKDLVLRHRGRRWATNASRHDVALSERLLLLKKA